MFGFSQTPTMFSYVKLGFVKFLQLAIASICFGLHYKSQTYNFDCDAISVVAFGGFIVISAGSLLSYLIDAPMNRKLDTFYSLIGCALFAVAGALNLIFFEQYSRSDWKHFGQAKGGLCVLQSVVFLGNCVLLWRETI